MSLPPVTTLPSDAALTREVELLQEVSARPDQRFFWLWQSPQCLVAPRKFASFPGFDAVAEELRLNGWPVHLRSTGGDVTPQGAGVINVTHVYASSSTKAFDLERAYDALCQPIEAALGNGASRGWQPGAFCDGAHNVQFNGLKFAGTAMRFRPCRTDKSRYAVLAHALMLMAPPSQGAIDALNHFLSALNQPRQISLPAHTGLPEGMAQDVFLERLRDAFAARGRDAMQVLI